MPVGVNWQTLDVWANSTDGSTTSARFVFFADNELELPTLVSPANESIVPSWTPLNFSFPEPLRTLFFWEDAVVNGSSLVPAGNGLH